MCVRWAADFGKKKNKHLNSSQCGCFVKTATGAIDFRQCKQVHVLGCGLPFMSEKETIEIYELNLETTKWHNYIIIKYFIKTLSQ